MSQTRLLARLRREFREHPGIAVTLPQAHRLWSLDEHSAAQAFAALTAEGFLQRVDDVYLWADAPVPSFRPRMPNRGLTVVRSAV
jgi:agmatine/peptidylarginine deiminase